MVPPGLLEGGLQLVGGVDWREVDVWHEGVGPDEADVPIAVRTEGVLFYDDLSMGGG